MRRLSTAITECGATCYSLESMTGYVMSLLYPMLAPPRPFVPSSQPSTTVVKAAQNAATSQHAQVNLIRMVKSLEKSDPAEDGSNATRRRDWEVST
jgi:hypothetical protein